MGKLLQVLSLFFQFSKKSSCFLVSFYCLLSRPFKPSCCVLLTIINLVFINVNVFGQTTIFRSATTGDWNTAATWESSTDNGINWSAASVSPSSTNGTITIQSGHTVTITANVTVDELTVNTGGNLSISSGQTLVINNGSGVDFTLSGTLVVNGTLSNNGQITVSSGGYYNHANGTILPTNISFGTNGSAGTLEVSGTATCSNLITLSTTSELYNVIWTSSGSLPTGGSSGSATLCKGDFTLNNASASWQIYSSGSGSVSKITVNGNVTLTAGTINCNNGNGNSSGGTNSGLDVAGNYTQSGGTFNIVNTSSGTFTGALYVQGNFTHTGGTFSSTGNGSVFLNGTSGTQTLESTGQLNAVTYNVAGSGAQCQVAAGKTFIQSSSTSFVIANGTSTIDYLIEGTHKRSGTTFTINTSAAISIGNFGIYEHNINAGSIPTASWSSGSTCNITGVTANAPTGLGQSFSNFTWNCPNMTGAANLSANLTTVTGLLKISNTATFDLRLCTANGATNLNANYGNINIEDGTLSLIGGGSNGSNISNIFVSGNVTISGNGKLDFSSFRTASGSNLYLSGNLILLDNSSITRTTATPSKIIFNKSSGIQNLTVSSSAATPISGTISFDIGTGFTTNILQLASNVNLGTGTGVLTVLNGSALDFAGFALTGSFSTTINGNGVSNAGALTNSSATAVTFARPITLASASEIEATSGNISLTGAINNGGFLLTIDGTNAVSIGTGVMSGSGGLTKNGSGTLTLTAVNTYSGNTAISQGTLSLSGTGTISSSAIITVASGAIFNVSAKTTNVAFGASQVLSIPSTGSNTTSSLTVGSDDGVTLGSTGGITFTAYDGGATAPLTVGGASAGALALNSSPIIVTTTSALALGTYTLIAKTGSASGVTGTPGALTVNGLGLVANSQAAVSIVSGQLILYVCATPLEIPTTTAGTSAACTSISANWNASANVTGYFLDVSTVNTFASFVTGFNNLNVGNVTTYNVTGLTAGTTYYYRVRSTNSCGTSASSTVITYATLSATPSVPTSTAGTSAACTSISANWNASANATGYFLDVSTVNTFASFVTGYNDLNVGNVTTYNVTGLTEGTTYYYRVRATNSCGTSASSTVITYATLINTVGAPSSLPTLCVNTLLTNITHATTGATGIGTPIGLPSGVTVAWAGNTITISGTPTSTGVFNYTIPLSGGCGSVNAVGTITVISNWYSKSGQTSPTVLTNWTANPDGTGANPSNFTKSGDVFLIQSGHSYTLIPDWTLGANVNLKIEGTLNPSLANLTIGGSTSILNGGAFIDDNVFGTNTFTGLLSIANGGSLSTSNNSAFVFGGGILNEGTFNKTGTGAITFNATQNFTITSPVTSFSGNVTVTAGTLTILGANPLTLTNNLIVNSGASLIVSNTGSFNVSGTTTISGSLTDNNNAAASTFTGLVTLTTGILDLSSLSTANCIFDGGITYTAGTFNVPNATINTTGNRTITAASAINWLAENILFTGTGTLTLSGSGGVTIGGTANLNIPGALTVNASSKLTLNTSGISTVNAAITVNGLLDINGKILRSLANISVATTGTLNIGSNGFLRMANATTITNAGVFRAVGTSGNIATLTRDVSGTYSVVSNNAASVFHSNFALIEYTGGAGISISNGSIDATNNFSNTTFQNGTGTAYLTISTIANTSTINSSVFELGPTYNVSRTTGTGAMTFVDAGGALAAGTAGEANDNDNGNPGTLLIWQTNGGTYYSQGTANFSSLSNWNTLPGGGGATPTSAKLTDGSSAFIIQNTHTVTIDQDLALTNLSVSGGGNLIFGNNTTNRTITLEGNFTISSGASVSPGASNATHNLTIKGNLDNNGNSNFSPTTSRVINVNFDGITGTISGSSSPLFNNITFNSPAIPISSVTYTAAIALDVNGNVTLNSNAVLNAGNFTHTVGGNWFQRATNALVSSGTIIFDGPSVQSIGGAAPYNFGVTFNHLSLVNSTSIVFNTACTINGNFSVNSNTSVSTGAANQTFNGDFIVNNGSTFTSSATTIFNGTIAQSINLSNCELAALTFSNTGVKNTSGTITVAITGLTTISSGTTVDGALNYLTAGRLRVDGTCNWSGLLTFTGTPANPTIYTGSASNTMSLGTADIIIDGQISVGFVSPATSNTVSAGGNLTVKQNSIQSNWLLMLNNAMLVGNSLKTLTLEPAGSFNVILYSRGTDNFPTGFGNYSLAISSYVIYDAAFSQTVRGNISYGILRASNLGTKTADGPLDINGPLQIFNGVTLDLNGFNHTLAGNLDDNNQTPTVINTNGTGSFTLDATDADQIFAVNSTGNYNFNDFSIVQLTPSAARTKTINSPLTITGNFNALNPSGDANLLLNITLSQNDINAIGSSNTFTLGANVRLNVRHSDFGATTMSTFEGAKSLDVSSVVNYYGTAQTIANGFTYGGINFSGSGNKTASSSLDINGNVTGNGGDFVDGGYSHTVAGNWLLSGAYYTNPASLITLDGNNQNILSGTTTCAFSSLTAAGSGTKSMVGGTITINNLFTINNGVTFDANSRNVISKGDWVQQATGVFTQTTAGLVIFNGATANQNITSNLISYFGNIRINKPTAFRTVKLNSSLDVNGYLDVYGPNSPVANPVTSLDGELDFTNQSLYVGDDFFIRTGSNIISTGSTLYLDGLNSQVIYMNCTSCALNNLELQNAGSKILTQATGSSVDINGYVNIDGTTLNGSTNGIDLTVEGNWTNTGVFDHIGRTVTFDGANQSIGQSSFGNVVLSGTATKTLAGSITLNNSLTIGTNVTFDVSTNNYGVSIGGNWNNFASGSVFNPRNGTVTFNGSGTQFLSTGSTVASAEGFTPIGSGKSFYDVVINKTAGTIYLSNTTTTFGDLDVLNDISISTGTGSFSTFGFDIVVKGNFNCTSTFNMSSFNSVLVLGATSGTKTFTSGASAANTYRDIYVNASGASYVSQDNLIITNNPTAASTTGLIVNGGTFNLNGKSLTFNTTSNSNVLVVNSGGTFNVGAGGIVYFSNQNDVLNNGGNLMVVGTISSPATFTRLASATTGYTIIQNSGIFHAKYYKFEYLNNAATENGLQILGGSIDNTNNFSEGTFTNGFTNSQQYFDLSGLSQTWTAYNVEFNAGPLKNVKFTSGTGQVLFLNATGSLYGAAYENDDGSATAGRIRWTNGGIFWDGGAGDGLWNSPLNWITNIVPTATDTVILDHSFVLGAYTVDLSSGADASVFRLTLDKGASVNAVNLTIGGANTLTVSDNVNILTGCTLTSLTSNNNITVGGNFTNSGNYIPGPSTLILNPSSGNKTFSIGSSSLNNLTVNGSVGTVNTLSAPITINGNLNVNSGGLDVSTGNHAVNLKGNWYVNGSTLFTPRLGTVTLSQTGPITQTISGGAFYNLTTSAASATSTKQLFSNLTITNNLIIGANTIFDAGSNNLYIGGAFTNNSGINAFSQTGTGTIDFNGTGNQTIENGTSASIFNKVVVSSTTGTPTKTWSQSSTINGTFDLNNAVTLNLLTNTLSGAGSTNVFNINANGGIQLRGASNFPSGFETINLSSTSTVTYVADLDQTVFSVPSPGYGNLVLQRSAAGTWIKTAAGNLIIQGNLTIHDVFTSLNCNTNSANITLTGNLAVANGYTNSSTAPINWGTGTTTLTHVGSVWAIDADILRFNNLVLNTAGTITMNSNLTITGDVSVNSGATLTMGNLTMTGLLSKAFNLNNGSRLNCAIPSTTGVAFPINFGNYAVNANSLVFLNSAANINQTLKTTNIVYGNLQFANTARNITLENSALVVAGYFYQTTTQTASVNPTLVDNGQNMTFGGDVFFGNYVPSSNTLTQTFNGTLSQTIRDYFGNALILSNVIFSGTGLKTLVDVTPDFVTINGNLTINSGSQVTSAQAITFNGTTWQNNGTWSHTGNTLSFNNTGAVNINVGGTNTFNNLDFTGNGTFTFNSNNADINGNFTITSGTVNLGSLTHTIAGNLNVGANTLNSGTSNITFDGVNQTVNLPVFTANNIICANTGTKTMAGTWNINNLTINSGVTLNTVSGSNYPINLTGNWINNGSFTSNLGTVTFNGATSPITVNNNLSTFNNVDFSPSAAVTYNITAPSTTVKVSSTIGTNASLILNGNTLIVGSNTASPKFLTVNGLIHIDGNAALKFDNRNGTSGTDPVTMTVSTSGTLKVVGTPSNIATITFLANSNPRHIINVNGNLQARYYLIEYLDNNGMNVSSTATLDPINNLSDGTWSNISTASGTAKRYLILDCPDPGTTIANVTFNFPGTPTIGTHYNVQRSNSASGSITFVDALGGNLGDFKYEDDAATAPSTSATTGKIIWPTITQVTWTGAVSTDWHTPDNWSPAIVPTNLISASIPLVTNNPIISTDHAFCKNLTLTNGQLTLSGGFNLTTSGNIAIGTGTGAGVMTFATASSTINCSGNWTRGSNGVFVHGNGTVVFSGSTGASTITPLTSNFYNIELNNATSVFYFVGSNINFLGNVTVTSGQLYPNTLNYNYNISGNLICNGSSGTFNTTNIGTVTFNGSNQTISNASLYNIIVSGTNTKSTTGTINIIGTTTINSNLTASSGSIIDFNGNVTVNSSGTLNDGGNSHTFSGTTWTGNGAYAGSGTITFDRSAVQTVAGGNFNNLAHSSETFQI